MCGLCVERGIVLDTIKNELLGILPDKKKLNEGNFWQKLEAISYLREATDFVEAFDWLRQGIGKSKVSSLEYLPVETILLRALEMRTAKGFNDPAYQKLLHKPLFRSLIKKACGRRWENNFAQATSGLDAASLSILYNADTFLQDNKSLEQLRFDQALPACRNLLRHYYSWWLKGERLRKNDLEERFKETGVFDPIEDIAEDQHDRFNILLRALYFSVLTIGKFKASKKILWAVANTPPAGIPEFLGNDLWLQRVSALTLYDMVGFDNFIRYFPDFRITIFYYIGLKRGYTDAQKKLLREAAHQYPENERDDFMRIEDCGWE